MEPSAEAVAHGQGDARKYRRPYGILMQILRGSIKPEGNHGCQEDTYHLRVCPEHQDQPLPQ